MKKFRTGMTTQSLEEKIDLITSYKKVTEDIKKNTKKKLLIIFLEQRLQEKLVELMEECKRGV